MVTTAPAPEVLEPLVMAIGPAFLLCEDPV